MLLTDWLETGGFSEPPGVQLIARSVHRTLKHFTCCLCVCVCVLCSVMSDSLQPHELATAKLLYSWDSPGKNMEWVAVPSSRGFPQPRDRTHVSCISCVGRQILHHWATWEALYLLYYWLIIYNSGTARRKICTGEEGMGRRHGVSFSPNLESTNLEALWTQSFGVRWCHSRRMIN